MQTAPQDPVLHHLDRTRSCRQRDSLPFRGSNGRVSSPPTPSQTYRQETKHERRDSNLEPPSAPRRHGTGKLRKETEETCDGLERRSSIGERFWDRKRFPVKEDERVAARRQTQGRGREKRRAGENRRGEKMRKGERLGLFASSRWQRGGFKPRVCAPVCVSSGTGGYYLDGARAPCLLL